MSNGHANSPPFKSRGTHRRDRGRSRVVEHRPLPGTRDFPEGVSHVLLNSLQANCHGYGGEQLYCRCRHRNAGSFDAKRELSIRQSRR
jgi:hypothetical protein